MARPENILVLGSGGQVGTELQRQLEQRRVLAKTREMFDITQHSRLADWLPTLRPDLVINCAAYTDSVKAEHDAQRCWDTNVLAVQQLVGLCNQHAIPFIQLSSDLVFGRDTAHKQPYTEADPVGPLSVLGQSQVAAEHSILNATRGCHSGGWLDCGGYWIIRTSCLYERPWRPHPRNFPQWLLNMSERRRGPIAVPDTKFTAPTYVPHFVKALLHVVDNLDVFPWGLYHLAAPNHTSWYEFAKEIAYRAGKSSLQVVPVSSSTLPMEYTPLEARLQPSWSVLSSKKFVAAGGPVLPSWQAGVEEYCEEHSKLLAAN